MNNPTLDNKAMEPFITSSRTDFGTAPPLLDANFNWANWAAVKVADPTVLDTPEELEAFGEDLDLVSVTSVAEFEGAEDTCCIQLREY